MKPRSWGFPPAIAYAVIGLLCFAIHRQFPAWPGDDWLSEPLFWIVASITCGILSQGLINLSDQIKWIRIVAYNLNPANFFRKSSRQSVKEFYRHIGKFIFFFFKIYILNAFLLYVFTDIATDHPHHENIKESLINAGWVTFFWLFLWISLTFGSDERGGNADLHR